MRKFIETSQKESCLEAHYIVFDLATRSYFIVRGSIEFALPSEH